MSNSLRAVILANEIVAILTRLIILRGRIEDRRMLKNTPAVTRVEECTKEETGVGAAIAAGSQAENGIWALFVNAAAIKITGRIPL